MHALDDVFDRLQRSAFRQRFALAAAEQKVLRERGLPTILAHAQDLIAQRLAPAIPKNDGKQTPFRGHPVFIAQHATATCCRGCLLKWHAIPSGRELSASEQAYVVEVVGRWLRFQRSPFKRDEPTGLAELPLFAWGRADQKSG
jgi:hypothetical protein